MGFLNMFGGKPGYVCIRSKKDPRWNYGERVESLVVMAGIHPVITEKIEELKKFYGEQPEDLEYSCMKD